MQKTSSRKLFAILFGLPLVLVLPVALLGASVLHTGVLEIEVVEKGEGGTSVGVKVPGAILPVAMHLIPDVALDDVRCEIDAETRAALDVARVALGSIARGPDGVYVDVRSRDEVVHVMKEGDTLRVFVDTPSEVVRVSVPLRVVGSVLDAI